MQPGKDGSYGTSVERFKALDPASDIILAFRQNGRLLTPDHGYPLRIIIPGRALCHTPSYRAPSLGCMPFLASKFVQAPWCDPLCEMGPDRLQVVKLTKP